jgi:putative DNA primase/helicase
MAKRVKPVTKPVTGITVSSSTDYFPHSDLGNAERFVDKYSQIFRYDHQRRAWLAWQGHWWSTVEESVVFRAAVRVVREVKEKSGPDTALHKWMLDTESGNHLREMINRARNMRPVSIEEGQWDQDAYLFGVANGVIDLRTGTFRIGQRDDYITQHSPVLFDSDAYCPAFDKSFAEIFLGRADLCRYVLKALGYSMTGDARERCLFIMHGSGNNGKSLLSSVIGYVMGDYGKSTPSETLSATREEGPRNDIARLADARFVTASESALKRGVAEEMLKRITGKDVIVARFLHREFFEFIPRFKFWLSCNHKPPIQGVDAAIWSRIPLIPFDAVFRDKAEDQDLDTKLIAEAPGILNRLIEGCLQWQQEGLQQPECIRLASADYRSESNPIAPFLDACCGVDQTQKAEEPADGWAMTKDELFIVYVAYCHQMHIKPDAKNVFGANIKAAGFAEGRRDNVRWWKGIRISRDPSDW